MRFVLIILLLFGGCVGFNIYTDTKSDERRAIRIAEAQAQRDLINELWNKDPQSFLASVDKNNSNIHLHSEDELMYNYRERPFSVDLQDHFPINSSHVWIIPYDYYYISGMVFIDVQETDNPSEYLYWLVNDGYGSSEPLSTAIKLTCSTKLLDYIRVHDDARTYRAPESYLYLNFKVTTKIITEFGEVDEEDDYYFSQTFGAQCHDFYIGSEKLYPNQN